MAEPFRARMRTAAGSCGSTASRFRGSGLVGDGHLAGAGVHLFVRRPGGKGSRRGRLDGLGGLGTGPRRVGVPIPPGGRGGLVGGVVLVFPWPEDVFQSPRFVVVGGRAGVTADALRDRWRRRFAGALPSIGLAPAVHDGGRLTTRTRLRAETWMRSACSPVLRASGLRPAAVGCMSSPSTGFWAC